MRKNILLLWTVMATVVCSAQQVYNVHDFGAKGNGVHIDSRAINEAISQAAYEGGGTVRLPAGVYLCYSVRLKSNITLQLDSGAVMKAAMPKASETYDLPEENLSVYQDFGHSHWKNSLIWGIGLRNVAITGKGRIDGSGVLSRGKPTLDGLPVANKAIALRDCRRVKITDLEMLNCGHFALLLTGVDTLTIERLTIDSNRDGIDIDCCEHVKIRHCRVNTLNDDAIVLKTSYGLNRLKPTANVIIEHCHVTGYDVGTLIDGTKTTHATKAPDQDGPTGRIKLGTESNGDFRNIIIRDCTFNHCRGLALETVDGSQMENILVFDIKMKDINNAPFYIRAGNRNRGPKGLPASTIRNVRISNITVEEADSRYASIIAGNAPGSIAGVTLSNIKLQYRGGVTMEDVRSQRGINPFFTQNPNMKGYPEPSAHGIQPASCFVISDAKDITLKDIDISFMQPDERPKIMMTNTESITIERVSPLKDKLFEKSDHIVIDN